MEKGIRKAMKKVLLFGKGLCIIEEDRQKMSDVNI